jgi:hypothetical protein
MPIRTELLRRLAAALIVAAAAHAEEAERFVGKWQAERNGEVYLVLTVAAGAPLQMTLKTAGIHVDETGEISEVRGKAEHEERVLESKLENGRLVFRTEQESGDVIGYEMRIEADGTALLRLADAPDWVKPFGLKRS